jgi:hypothetical protein
VNARAGNAYSTEFLYREYLLFNTLLLLPDPVYLYALQVFNQKGQRHFRHCPWITLVTCFYGIVVVLEIQSASHYALPQPMKDSLEVIEKFFKWGFDQFENKSRAITDPACLTTL